MNINDLNGWMRYVRTHMSDLSEEDIEAIAVEMHDKAVRRAAWRLQQQQCQQGR
jgi:hypothetical protein